MAAVKEYQGGTGEKRPSCCMSLFQSLTAACFRKTGKSIPKQGIPLPQGLPLCANVGEAGVEGALLPWLLRLIWGQYLRIIPISVPKGTCACCDLGHQHTARNGKDPHRPSPAFRWQWGLCKALQREWHSLFPPKWENIYNTKQENKKTLNKVEKASLKTNTLLHFFNGII